MGGPFIAERRAHSCVREEGEVTVSTLLVSFVVSTGAVTGAQPAGALLDSLLGQNATDSSAASTAPAADAAAPAAQAEQKVEEKKEEKVSAGSAVLTPEQLAALSGWFFSVSIDHQLGLHTFVNPNNAYFAASPNAFVSYRTRIMGRAFAVGIQPFGFTGLYYEYTQPDSAVARRFTWTDAGISLSMPALFKDTRFTGITLNPSLQVVVPTTIESWGAGLISRIGVGLSLNRNFETPAGLFIVNASGVATFGIFKSTAVVVSSDPRPDSYGNPTVLSRTGETISDVAANNSMVAFRGGASITWGATDWLFFGASYGIRSNWNYKYSYNDTCPECTPKGLDVNGNPVARTDMVRTDVQTGYLFASFNITEAFSGTFYLYNVAPMLTRDGNHAIRFPWVDVPNGIPTNNTTLGFSLAATY